MVFFFAVSTTSASLCSPAFPLFIVIALDVLWAGAAVLWDSGAVVSDASIRLAIADCVGSNAFGVFTQYTAIS